MPDDAPPHPLYIVCLASYFKGGEFIRECKRQGSRVVLVTKEKLLGEEWPRESLDDIISVPNDATPELFIHTVTQLARPLKLDRVVALEEYDVMTASSRARAPAHLPGMGSTTARLFRDKLAMRIVAEEAGIRVPDFVHFLNYNEMRRVHGSHACAVDAQAALGRFGHGHQKAVGLGTGLARDRCAGRAPCA